MLTPYQINEKRTATPIEAIQIRMENLLTMMVLYDETASDPSLRDSHALLFATMCTPAEA